MSPSKMEGWGSPPGALEINEFVEVGISRKSVNKEFVPGLIS